MWILVLLLVVAPCLAGIVESVEFCAMSCIKNPYLSVMTGGTAGNVIANRLTENPKYSVLVLEGGGSHEDAPLDMQIPLFCTRLTRTQYDWNSTTVPQIGMNGRSIPYPRGRILGGSSSINCMGYTRGGSDDYDRYARLTNDPGWSWAKLQPYFRKNEKWTLPADNHDITGEFNPSAHGYQGINSVSLAGYSHLIDRRAIQATRELEEFPYNNDTNSGHQIGIGWTQSTINRGVRSSSATSYLGPQFIKRPNLNILLHAQVSRVLPTNNDKLAFRTVEFTEGVGGPIWRVQAKKEVILSAGTVSTAHILLNSGIGDAPTLSRIGIKPLIHLPSVGRNMSDHPVVSDLWIVKGTDTFEVLNRNATLVADALRSWNDTRTGPLVVSPFSQAGWIRLPANASIFQQFPDPSPGPHTAHFELALANGIPGPPPPTGTFLLLGSSLLSPLSRGSVTINSTNPFDPPVIDPNFLSSEFDMFALREALRSGRRLIAAPAWANYTISRVSNATTDAELDQYIRSTAGTVNHEVGTASMSPKGAKYGVVEPDLRVKGVVGLRVVDASVLPIVPAGHSQAAVYVVAERGADLIKEAWQ